MIARGARDTARLGASRAKASLSRNETIFAHVILRYVEIAVRRRAMAHAFRSTLVNHYRRALYNPSCDSRNLLVLTRRDKSHRLYAVLFEKMRIETSKVYINKRKKYL